MSARHLVIAITIATIPSMVAAATLEQWRLRPPRWQMNSSRSLEELEGCLGSKWAGTLSTKIQSMPIEKGMSYVNTGPDRNLLVDLTDDGDHRTIKLWLRHFFGITIGSKEQVEKLSACARG